ncbi:hypothetical protein RHGRI_015514 [Rhododendron griersonianum]|uniref:ERBB-3 BINDING PROTEIN 1 n=1 Tax=Rhododendron griersonianum TaxID=479676 RepID=A0AAV6KDJ6_9ERIC|nr:hypothetical protein RHGRI_015514 [Rhododendron griersonianum]
MADQKDQKKPNQSIPPYMKAISGSIGGTVEACCLQPIDVIKTRLQLDRSGAYKGIVHCGTTVARTEGVRALWKGLTPFATHMTLKYALRMGSNAMFQTALKDSETGKLSNAGRVFSGFGAGVLEALVVKIRLQQQKGLSPELLKYKGPIHCARMIIREEGLLGLWAGAAPTVMRNGTNQAAMFTAKNAFDGLLWKKQEGDGKVLQPWQSMISGFLAGTAGPVFTGPFDVVKTRLMAQSRSPSGELKYKGMIHAIRTIYSEEGLRALWKGLLPRLMRIPPGQAIMWAVGRGKPNQTKINVGLLQESSSPFFSIKGRGGDRTKFPQPILFHFSFDFHCLRDPGGLIWEFRGIRAASCPFVWGYFSNTLGSPLRPPSFHVPSHCCVAEVSGSLEDLLLRPLRRPWLGFGRGGAPSIVIAIIFIVVRIHPETMSDEEREEKELDLSSPEVVTKYKSAAEIVNKALQLVLSECKPKAKIVDICEKSDSFIREQSGNMYKNVKKKIERGVAFPTCISVNNTVCHFSPLASDETVLEEGDILKIDMGCHIDGFIAVVAHTHVLKDGPVTGRQADVIAAANTAAEVALRLVRPGRKNKDVTDAIQKVAAAYDCKIVEGVLSHQLKQFVIDGNKVVLSISNPETRVDDAEFEENEVYAIDIVTSTGEGKPKLLDEKQTTIYKRAVDKNYHLKMKASRFIFSEISQKFPIMPFTARFV